MISALPIYLGRSLHTQASINLLNIGLWPVLNVSGQRSSIVEHFQLLEVSVSEEVNLEAALIFAGTKHPSSLLPSLLCRTPLDRLIGSEGIRGRLVGRYLYSNHIAWLCLCFYIEKAA